MASLFFYGTLRHRPLLETVLGAPVADDRLQAASLPGHAVRLVSGEPFPMILKAQDSAPGLVLRDVSEVERARLDFFEGGFDYDLRASDLQTSEPVDLAPLDLDRGEGNDARAQGPLRAEVYFPPEGRFTPGAPFDLDAWAARWGATFCIAAEEMMARFGRQPARRVAQLAPFIRARAWARGLAEPAPRTIRDGGSLSALDIAPRGDGWEGFFRITPLSVRHRRFDGTWSPMLEREIIRSFDVSLVLPYDPRSDRLLLIEQLRFGPVGRGDPAPWVQEPVAGFIEAGESPETAARREAVEEAGVTPDRLIPMTRVYASPGYSTEFFHCFLALCDLSGRSREQGGLAAEHEDIRNHTIPFEQAMGLLDSGEVNAGPLAMMLLWLARQREALRASA